MSVASEQVRVQAIKAAQAAADKTADTERVRLSWKSADIVLTVVEVPLTAVVLNPRSHRIRAQLESSPKRELIVRDPFGEGAQEEIARLLRTADRFKELRDNLEGAGQADPGVVTHTGLLVNANTRCVALRDLRKRYIRVAILPDDANEEEIDRLELRLQMKRDFTSDYTFTNELLFIDDLVRKHKFKNPEIAIEMGWASRSDKNSVKKASERVQQHLRMLAIIRELQDLSGGGLRLTEFDNARQAILELDEDYERLKKRTPEAAQKLRDTRLAALLSGAGYRELREINETFLEKYLMPSMEEQPLFRGKLEQVVQGPPSSDEGEEVPGLDVLEGASEDSPSASETPAAAPLLSLLAESAGKNRIVIDGDKRPTLDVPRNGFVDQLKQAFESGAEDARIDRQQGDILDRPRIFIRKANKNLRSAISAYGQASRRNGFDEDGFRRAVDELTQAHKSLVKLMDGKD